MKKEDFTFDMDSHERFFYSQLSEYSKRQYAGLEAMKLGYNGVSTVSSKFCINRHTVRKGKKELQNQTVPPPGKVRKKGGGRKKKRNYQWVN